MTPEGLFDCKDTPVKDIARIMAAEMGLEKLKRVQQEIGKQIAALKERHKLTAQAG